MLADAPGGRLVMGMQQRLQINLLIVEEPIGGFGLTGRAVQRRTDGGGGMLAERLGQLQQARAQPPIGKVHLAEFLLGPAGGGIRRRGQAQPRRRAQA